MRFVVVESPLAGDREKNKEYAKRCVMDCLRRGEAPYASHLFFDQPGLLDDDVPEERTLGMEAGFAIGARADATVVYTDLGISEGMKMGIRRAKAGNRVVEYRNLNMEVEK